MVPHSTHCVFRHRDRWLAGRAQAIREVMPRPQLVVVPPATGALAGLCYIRGEFLPVVTLEGLAPDAGSEPGPVMLVIDDAGDCWGIAVDEVDALASLDASPAPEGVPGWAGCISGWATHEKHGVVQVIDEIRLRDFAAAELSAAWSTTRLTTVPSRDEAVLALTAGSASRR